MSEEKKHLHCSFCGREESESGPLLGNNGTYICKGCVAVCNEMMNGAGQKSPSPTFNLDRTTPRRCCQSPCTIIIRGLTL